MRRKTETLFVIGSALLTLTSASLLCCPTARAGSPTRVKIQTPAAAPPAPAESEDSLDDDRAEHWAVPGIAREGRVQCEVLAGALLCAGALSARRRGRLKGQKRHG